MSGSRALLDDTQIQDAGDTQASGSKCCLVMLHRQTRSVSSYSAAQEAGQCLVNEHRLLLEHELQCSTADLS